MHGAFLMKKLLLVTTITVAFTPALVTAQSTSTFGSNVDTNQLDNFFVAGGHYRDDLTHDNGVFQNLRVGWRWNGIIGPEIGYAYFGKVKRDYNEPARVYSIQPRAFTAGVNGKYNVYNSWFVTAHGGWMRSHTNVGCTMTYIPCDPDRVFGLSGGPSVSNTSDRNGWYGGIGVGYDVTRNFSIGINYDDYNLKYNAADNSASGFDTKAKRNIAAYSASAEYRF
jgi:OmpA-OmpF porin, OOP family